MQKKQSSGSQVQPIRADIGLDAIHTEQQLRARVLEILNEAETKLTQADMARQIGVSSSTMSQWLSGTYGAKSEKVTVKVEKWLSDYLKRRQRGELPDLPEFLMTPTAKRISAVLDYSRSAGDISLIYGAAGVGKTKTIQYYKSTHPNVWHVTSSPATNSVMGLLTDIAEALGMAGYVRNRQHLQREIARRMQGTKGLLVVDEAQSLPVQALEQLRYFTDHLDIGLVLCGNVFVATQFNTTTKGAYLDRLSSRVGRRLHLTGATKGDIEAVIDAWNFTDPDCRDTAFDIGRRLGALRVLNKCFRLAMAISRKNNRTEMCCDDLRRAAKELGVLE